MIRACALAAWLIHFPGLAQAAEPGGAEQKCQHQCGEAMTQCMTPCLGGKGGEASPPEKRKLTMACVKKCSDAQELCIKACDKKKAP